MRGGGIPWMRAVGVKHAYGDDHGVRCRAIGSMTPVAPDGRATRRVLPVDGPALVTCWCEQSMGMVSMADITQGRTWSCGPRCHGDAADAPLAGRKRRMKPGRPRNPA